MKHSAPRHRLCAAGLSVPHCVSFDEEEELALLLESKYPGSDNSLLPYIGPDGQGWPNEKIPVEIFEAIGKYLSRECLQSFRLSCKEFERKTSRMLFRDVVVLFQPDLYGGDENSHSIKVEHKGKGTAEAQFDLLNEERDSKLPYPYGVTAGREDIHKGMKVFHDWGPHINKFGLSFELSDGKPYFHLCIYR